MMNMNARTASKKKKPMMPFMCHSQAATAVCVSSADAALSAIVPASRTTRMMINNNYNAARCSRLVESRRLFDPAVFHGNKPIVSLYSMITKEPALNHLHHHHHHAKAKMSTLKNTPSVTLSADNVYQEVVMRVALHCQGCAGKVKKHISKMEGKGEFTASPHTLRVTSFSIDLETKLVTVRGHVSPVGVTESISKVKKAELLLCS